MSISLFDLLSFISKIKYQRSTMADFNDDLNFGVSLDN